MELNSQIRHCSPFYTGYGQAHVSTRQNASPRRSVSLEGANADFTNLHYARLKDENKEHNQWVGVLHYVQYSKDISSHRGINATPYAVHFGRTPPEISVDMSLPREVVLPFETEDQLEQVLGCRQVLNMPLRMLLRQQLYLHQLRFYCLIYPCRSLLVMCYLLLYHVLRAVHHTLPVHMT